MKQTARTEASSICQTGQLTGQQISEIRQLVSLCREKDHTGLSCPLEEDGVRHYLLYGKKDSPSALLMLRSVLSILPCETEAECIAFTHPDWRKHGYFTKLLELALETFEDFDILFPVSGNCPDTLATLEALGAEPESQELQMELELQLSDALSVSSSCTLLPLSSDISGDCCWELYKTGADSRTLLGSCQTARSSESCVCLHHVEILPQFRKQGYGTALLTRLISALRQAGIRRMLLQVSGSNEAALALYKKQGFQITETLSYYLY